MNFAIILAAGRGVRFGSSSPKQLVRLAGKPVFEHALEAFERHPAIDGIVLVGTEGVLSLGSRMKSRYRKVIATVQGGPTRAESTWQGLQVLFELASPDSKVLIHDGARPFLEQRIITDMLQTLDSHDAADTVIDSSDTMVFVDSSHLVDIPDRSRIKRGQTPQGFRFAKIRRAFECYIAEEKTHSVTDDCAIYMRYRQPEDSNIGVVAGSERNIKLTYASDLPYAEEILRSSLFELPEAKGSVEGKTIVVFGGTSGIGLSLCQRLRDEGAATYSLGRSTGCDVANAEQVEESLKRIVEESGGIDAVVLTAGAMCSKSLVDHELEDVDRLVDTNLLGAVFVAQKAFPYLKETAGQLLFFSSSSYTRGREGYTLYSATKAALVNLCQGLSEEWRPYCVRVNCLVPSRTKTPLRLENFSSEDDRADLLDPMEVAMQAESLLRSHLTGQIVAVRSRTRAKTTCLSQA